MGERAGGRVTDVPGGVADGDGIDWRVRRGLGWSFLNNVVSRAGGTLAGIVIARLLAPEDFGTFAVALVALNAVMNINDLGVSLAIVRGQRPPEKIIPTVTTLAVTGSTLLYAVAFVAAPFVASAMHSPGATGVLRVLCLNIVVDAFTSVPAAMLTRRFMQGARMAVDLLSFAVGTATTIGLAVAGFGPWSLALGQLTGNLAAAATIYRVAGVRFHAGFDREEAVELLRFGRGGPARLRRPQRRLRRRRAGARPHGARAVPAGLQPVRMAGEHVLDGRAPRLRRGLLPDARRP